MTEPRVVALPGGVWRDGTCHRAVQLRPLSGADQAALAEYGEFLSVAAQSSLLLNRCLIGLVGEGGAVAARELLVGDREALLLELHRFAFGEQLEAVVECPGCAEKLEVTLAVGDLLQPPYDHDALEFDEDVAGRRLRFRLPTGVDQEAAAATGDIALGVRELVRRCVSEVDGTPAVSDEVLDEVGAALAARWAALDPQAEMLLNLSCPACGLGFQTSLDAGSFLMGELAVQGRFFYHEVHALAAAHHWAEAEIMALPLARRRRYVELLGGEGST